MKLLFVILKKHSTVDIIIMSYIFELYICELYLGMCNRTVCSKVHLTGLVTIVTYISW